jgi:hypothetical protein
MRNNLMCCQIKANAGKCCRLVTNGWSFLWKASAVGKMDMPAILVFTAPLSEPLHHRGTASAQPTCTQHALYNYHDTHRAPFTPRIFSCNTSWTSLSFALHSRKC